jgi:hypothetical protein
LPVSRTSRTAPSLKSRSNFLRVYPIGELRADSWNSDGSERRDEVHRIVIDELRYLRAFP